MFFSLRRGATRRKLLRERGGKEMIRSALDPPPGRGRRWRKICPRRIPGLQRRVHPVSVQVRRHLEHDEEGQRRKDCSAHHHPAAEDERDLHEVTPVGRNHEAGIVAPRYSPRAMKFSRMKSRGEEEREERGPQGVKRRISASYAPAPLPCMERRTNIS